MRSFRYIAIACFTFAALLAVAACAGRTWTQEELDAYAAKEQARNVAASANKNERGARDQQIAQAASNLGPLSQAVSAKGEPALGAGIDAQKRDIDNALGIPLALYPPPVVNLEKLLRDAEGALDDYRKKSTELQTKLDSATAAAAAANKARDEAEAVAKHEKEKADAAARREWWYGFGATVLTVVGTGAAIAARLGLPGGGLVQTVVDVITPAVKARRVTAETAVAAADVGRQGLAMLESYIGAKHPQLAAQLTSVVAEATGGRADGLNDLFKTVAKSFVVDKHGGEVEAVDSLLTSIRGRNIDTVGGVATALSAIVPALVKRA